MKKKLLALSLFSGGLDSILAVKIIEKLGIEVIPIFFETPFFKADKAKKVSEKAGFGIKIIDISEEYLEMLQNPVYGFGRNMNPCVDCHGMMFRKATELLEELNADFLVSGEVLGQRPMSQRKDSMNCVGKLSKAKDLIIRPLSQKFLKDTKPIREGWLKKEDLYDIQGRSRNKQIELAKYFNIDYYENSGGGCLLTEVGCSERLKDLIKYKMLSVYNCEFLKYGRHYRIDEETKFIIGRKMNDNYRLTELSQKEIVLKTTELTGPLGFIQFKNKIEKNIIEICAGILLRYNNKANDEEWISYGKKFKLNNKIKVRKFSDEIVQTYIINGR